MAPAFTVCKAKLVVKKNSDTGLEHLHLMDLAHSNSLKKIRENDLKLPSGDLV